MRKVLIIIGLITFLALCAPSAFAGYFDYKYTADSESTVSDIQTTNGGFIAGGAKSSAEAKARFCEADATTDANSAMISDTEKYKVDGGRRKTVNTWGEVSSSGESKGGLFGKSKASAMGGIIQGSKVELEKNGTGANAMNFSGAGYMSSDRGNCFYAKSDANGSASTGGMSDAFRGRDGTVKFAGAYTSNFANATGDKTVAGGRGQVGTFSNRPGITTAGNASFKYSGNGSGYANSNSWTNSYTENGVSYKSAYSEASAGKNTPQ